MLVLETIAVAFSMFSALPVPHIPWNEKNMRYVMCAFPLIGAAIGTFDVLWLALCYLFDFPNILRGAGLCLMPIIITGGIHLDGFADTCDALASHGTPEKKQEILNDPHLGAFAAIKLCCYFMANFALWTSLPHFDIKALCIIILDFCLSRAMSGLAVTTFPLSKESGLAYAFAKGADKKPVKLFLQLLIILICAGLILCGTVGAVTILAAICTFFYYKRMAIKQFGGLSGDLSGWFLQTVELVMLCGLCAVQLLEGFI